MNIRELEANAERLVASMEEQEREQRARERLNKIENGSAVAQQGGPTPEQYDYDSAAREVDFEPMKPYRIEVWPGEEETLEGGIDLPNRYTRYNEPVLGYDISTGQRMIDMDDPQGLAKQGVEKIRSGVTNTEHGPDGDTLEGMTLLAYQARKNGLSLDDLNMPLDKQTRGIIENITSEVDVLDTVVNAVNMSEGLELPDEFTPEEITSAVNVDALTPEQAAEVGQATALAERAARIPAAEDSERITREDLAADEQWLNASRVLWDYFGGGDQYPDDDKGTNAMVRQLSMLHWNEVEMGLLLKDLAQDNMGPEEAEALYYALNVYERLPWNDLQVWAGGASGFVQSPLLWAGAGFGKAAYQAAGKTAAMQTVKRLLQRKISEQGVRSLGVTASGAGVGGAGGAGWMASEEMMQQLTARNVGAQEGINMRRVAGMSAIGGVAGTVLGGALSGVLSPSVVNRVKNRFGAGGTPVGRIIRDQVEEAVGHPRYGSDDAVKGLQDMATPDGDRVQYLTAVARGDVRPRGADMGFPLDEGFYSRAQVNIQRNVERIYGDSDTIDPQELLDHILPQPAGIKGKEAARFGDWAAGNPNLDIPPLSLGEVQSMGLDSWLSNKAAAGEAVSQRELSAFMYARQPDLRVGMTYLDARAFMDGTPPNIYITKDSVKPRDLADSIVQLPFTDKLIRNMPIEESVNAEGTPIVRWTDPFTGEEKEIINGTPDMAVATTASNLGRMLKTNLSDSDLIRLAQDLDESLLLTDPVPPGGAFVDEDGMVGEMDFGIAMSDPQFPEGAPKTWSDMTLGPPELLDNYTEMRLFIPSRSNDVNNISADRFNLPYDELSPEDKQWVDLASEYTLDSATFNESAHYPLENNRLVSIRMQDVYNDAGDRYVMAAEIQSDLRASSLRHAPERQVDADANAGAIDTFRGELVEYLESFGITSTGFDVGEVASQGIDEVSVLIDDLVNLDSFEASLKHIASLEEAFIDTIKASAAGPDQPLSTAVPAARKAFRAAYDNLRDNWLQARYPEGYQPMTQTYREAAISQMVQHAATRGYRGISFPSTAEQVAEIEKWSDYDRSRWSQGVIDLYTKWIPAYLKKKSVRKRLGIVDDGTTIPLTSEGEQVSSQAVSYYTIDPEKARASADNMRPLFSVGAIGAPGAMQLMEQDSAETTNTQEAD